MKTRFKVQESGIKLLSFLRCELAEQVSAKAIKRAIDGKRCKVNGRVETFSTHPLSRGDVVEIDLTLAPHEKIATLYEDDALWIVNKPAGISSEPKNFSAKLVHRLDKETSGALILAKKESTFRRMVELFSQKRVKKEYLAIVDGTVQQEKGACTSRLAKKHTYQGQTVYGSSSKGVEAITHWKKLAAGNNATLLLCEPVTGRTHQIRVHLKELGHPILGDTQYAKTFRCAYHPSRHLLHAARLTFPHPETHVPLDVKAPLPADFLEALKRLSLKFKSL
jgi:23S rRNA-/tRNA-specific pseudouridylate synthase